MPTDGCLRYIDTEDGGHSPPYGIAMPGWLTSLFQGQKTHHLVLLDDSGSMRDRWGDTTAFDGGLEVVRKIAAEGERKPDTQTLTLLLLSNPNQPVYTQENLNKDFLGRLEGGL